jgi:hypothetical protein
MTGWLNLRDYTPLELLLFGVGGAMWVLAYAVLVVRVRRLKYVEMPFFAACCNIAWEFLWSSVLRTDMGRLFEWCYSFWFVLDVFIFWKLLEHGHKQIDRPWVRGHFKAVVVACTLLMGAVFYWMARMGLDDGVGARSAYLAQMAISTLYFLPLLDPARAALLSPWIAWLRSLGTGSITIFVFLRYRQDAPLLVLSGASLLLDGAFLFLLRSRRLRGSSSRRVDSRQGAPYARSSPTEMNVDEPPGVPSMRMPVPTIGGKENL